MGRTVGSVGIWFLKTLLIGVIGVLVGCVTPPLAPPASTDLREDGSREAPEAPESSVERVSPEADRDPEREQHSEEPETPDQSPTVADSPPESPPARRDPQLPQSSPPARVDPPPPQSPPSYRVDPPPPRPLPQPPQQATPEQLSRIWAYYGIRSSSSLGVGLSADPIIGETITAVRYARSGLRRGGIAPAATVMSVVPEPGLESGLGPGLDSGLRSEPQLEPGLAPGLDSDAQSEYLSVLNVHISGNLIASAEHFYGRAVLHLTYRTGPGKRLMADTGVRGPYRLSQVSPADAVLRSLRAIPESVYRDVLAFLDERWIEGVELTGLPYRIEHVQGGETRTVYPIFEIPPRVRYHLARFLPDSGCHYTIDPLTGTIRIVYIGDT